MLMISTKEQTVYKDDGDDHSNCDNYEYDFCQCLLKISHFTAKTFILNVVLPLISRSGN